MVQQNAISPPPHTAEPGAELCIIVPVLNEAGNIAALVDRLRDVLAGVRWEVIFVDDDSTDDTRAMVGAIGRADPRVRLLHRIGRRGLSSAFIEGAQASLAGFVAAMDGDLQHDETLLPAMLRALTSGGYDLAIGSRLRGRRWIGGLGTRAGRDVGHRHPAQPAGVAGAGQ